MKKTYSKPQIMFEDFSLSVSIASCEVDTNTFAKGECGLKFGRYTLFDSTISACDRNVDDFTNPYNGLCYHNPTESYNLFSS